MQREGAEVGTDNVLTEASMRHAVAMVARVAVLLVLMELILADKVMLPGTWGRSENRAVITVRQILRSIRWVIGAVMVAARAATVGVDLEAVGLEKREEAMLVTHLMEEMVNHTK